MSSSIGKLFTLTTFGESHGAAMGAVVDGCPAGISLTDADIQAQLDRRRPGQSGLTSPRVEEDRVEIVSGIEGGVSLGSSIGLLIRNRDSRSSDYEAIKTIPRPSHADLTYKLKYGMTASSGGGRSSARETVCRVAGGAVAEKFLCDRFGTKIVAWVSAVGAVESADLSGKDIGRTEVDRTPVRCPEAKAAAEMIRQIEAAKSEGDSVGGIVTCECRGVPAGWGEPVFDKLHACLAHAMMSIPACKGFEVGSGFAGSRMRGSEQNDLFVMKGGRLGTASNRSGGIQGGISNGEPVIFRVAFKPVASIAKSQQTVDFEGKPATLKIGGRHDPCVVPRAVVVVEAMAALVLADAALLARAFAPK